MNFIHFVDIDGVLNVTDSSQLAAEKYTNPSEPFTELTWFFNANHDFAKSWMARGEFIIYDIPNEEWSLSSDISLLGRYPFMFAFSRTPVLALNAFIADYGGDIVISSDWKDHHSLTWLQRLFKVNGIHADVLGVADSIKTDNGFNASVNNRVSQILRYTDKFDVDDYIIYDDMPLHENTVRNIADKFIQTVFYIGLTESSSLNYIKI